MDFGASAEDASPLSNGSPTPQNSMSEFNRIPKQEKTFEIT